MEKTFQTFAPFFDGFYNTVFEYDREEEDINYYNEENGTDFNYDDFTWDYADYHNRVSKSFVNRLEAELKPFLPIKIEYETLVSPREYNFTNDSINVTVECDLSLLIKLIADRKEDAAKYFKEKYTSCDGFLSFHSNDLEDWLNEDYILEKPAHRVGALLECLCSIELDKDDVYYWCDNEYWISFSPKAEKQTVTQ